MFGNKETSLNKEQSKLFNSILPEKHHRETWSKSDFLSRDLKSRVKYTLDVMADEKLDLEKQIKEKDKLKEEFLESINIEKYPLLKLFNVSNSKAKLLGMVDIGLVKTFTSSSSGNKLQGGAMQLIIEQAFEDSWKTSNAQMKGLNEVKLEFLKQCLKEYPECDSIINYQVDFRELGSSGNVFIYMRGTAAIIGNSKIEEINNGIDLKLKQWDNKFNQEIPKQIEKLTETINRLKETQSQVPNTFSGALKLVTKLKEK